MPAIELKALAGISLRLDKKAKQERREKDERTNVTGGAKRNQSPADGAAEARKESVGGF
jgi:hypothetical protein